MTAADVRRIAGLARLRVDDAAATVLAAELEALMRRVEVLTPVNTKGVEEAIGVGARGLPARVDAGPPIPLAMAIEAFAPHLQDGYLLVPRIARDGATPAP